MSFIMIISVFPCMACCKQVNNNDSS